MNTKLNAWVGRFTGFMLQGLDLGGEVADDVHGVATPERREALLRGDAGEAVDDARVAGNLARDDLRVRVLRLDEQLHALDRRGRGLRNSARNTAGAEVNEKRDDLRAALSGRRGGVGLVLAGEHAVAAKKP